MTQHVMCDLETWSTRPSGLIVSIGAVKFDRDTDVTPQSEAFHVGIVPNDFNGTFHIDPGTVGWWLDAKQDDARQAWNGLEKTDLQSALTAFIMWLNPKDPNDVALWGNGAAFDNVLLRYAYDKALGLGACPWHYRQDRCYKTYRSLTKDGKGLEVPMPESMGVPHSAVADALWQARHLQLILRAFDLPLI